MCFQRLILVLVFFRMNGLKQWIQVAVMTLLVLTVMAADGGKAEKQGESSMSTNVCLTLCK